MFSRLDLFLYELIVEKLALSKNMTANRVAGAVVLKNTPPNIPNSVLPETAELIQDYLPPSYRER
jgi:hypothetical protein